jgi:hypothetical protein
MSRDLPPRLLRWAPLIAGAVSAAVATYYAFRFAAHADKKYYTLVRRTSGHPDR